MNDCDRVRALMKMTVTCCERCHRSEDLTKLVVKGLGRATVCCTIASSLLPTEAEVDVTNVRLSQLAG